MTARPCSLKASTAAPSSRHCIAPGVCGSARLPPMKAPAKSVPPEMFAHQISACAWLPLVFDRAAKRALNQACVSALSGEPVEPRQRSCERLPAVVRSNSALAQLAKNAAPAPKKVDFDCATKRHSVAQSGLSFAPPGLPSKMQQVVPPSRPPTCEFHMIQPVELYQ